MAEMGNNLVGGVGEVEMTIHITRKATGLIETHQLKCPATISESQIKENEDGSHALDSCT